MQLTFALASAALAALSGVASAQQREVAFIGDSWASFSNNLFESRQICGSQRPKFRNLGCPGQTAEKMARNSKPFWCFKSPQNGYRETNADRYWLSIGGNDVLDRNCDDQANQIDADVRKIIQDVLAEEPSAKILITGYGVLSCDRKFCDGFSWNNIRRLFNNIARDYPQVYYFDVLEQFGATVADPDSRSDSSLYRDCIHLNNQGYDKFFNLPEFKNFFCDDNFFGGALPTPKPTPKPTPRPTPQPTVRGAAPTPAPEGPCEDKEGLTYSGGEPLPCADAVNFCSGYAVVRDRCAATCQVCEGGSTAPVCADLRPSGLQYSNGSPAECSAITPRYCNLDQVKNACPQSCGSCDAAARSSSVGAGPDAALPDEAAVAGGLNVAVIAGAAAAGIALIAGLVVATKKRSSRSAAAKEDKAVVTSSNPAFGLPEL
jgi:hypothetical protein